MPRLLAIIPEDGWAMVREGETIFFVRPPFRSSERAPVPAATLSGAISVHGYEAQPDAPEESWAGTIDRIRELMARVRERESLPPNGELLARMLRIGPPSALTGLLDRIEDDWLAMGDLRAADHALKALLAEDRVKSTKALLHRALALHDRLDDLRDKREARAPMLSPPPHIEAISKRPRLHGESMPAPSGAALQHGAPDFQALARPAQEVLASRKTVEGDTLDPGPTLCGHGTRAERVHYLGGGLWVCFECLAKFLVGGRKEAARCK